MLSYYLIYENAYASKNINRWINLYQNGENRNNEDQKSQSKYRKKKKMKEHRGDRTKHKDLDKTSPNPSMITVNPNRTMKPIKSSSTGLHFLVMCSMCLSLL